MKQYVHLDSTTRERIVESAGELLAEHGFRGATIRKICDRAGVNLSAIKYYFGSKEKLYSEVLSHWHEFAIRKYPPLLGVGEQAPAEAQLRAFVRSLLFRTLDKGKPAWFGKVMAREMVEPTQAFDQMLTAVMSPLNRLLASIVQKLIGAPVSEERIRLCCASILSQCFYYCNSRVITPLFKRDMSDPKEIEGIADHIMRFSLQGLQRYSEEAEKRGRKKRKILSEVNAENSIHSLPAGP